MHHSRRSISLPPSLRENYLISFKYGGQITEPRKIQASSWESAYQIALAQCKPLHRIHSIEKA